MRFINYVFYGALLTLAALSLGFFILVRFNFVANPLPPNFSDFIPKAYIVQSGSMSPAIKVGSIVITQKSENYVQGDIITFKNSPSDKNPTTHRIYFKGYPEGVSGSPTYLTAGDANEDIDPGSLQDGQIVGKVVFTLPYLGFLAGFAKDPKGFILLVIVPATIIIYEELKFLKSEFGKSFGRFWTKIRKKKASVQFNLLPEKADKPLPKISILLPLIGAFLVVTSLSLAYFFDVEESIGNILGAGTWGPPPPQIAQTLVINEVLPDTECFQGQTEAQWIELYNGYSVTVNLKNFKITDGVSTIDLVNSNTDLPAGQFALLAHSTSIWNSCYSDNDAITVNLGGQLNIDTGFLQLQDTNNVPIDTVEWGPTEGIDPPQNQSMERDPDGLDTAPVGTDFNASDFVVQPTPQPGL